LPDNQAHCIFISTKMTVYGLNEKEYVLITEKSLDDLIANLVIKIASKEINNKSLGIFSRKKIEINDQLEVPAWRNWKAKKTNDND
jgi:hypothetical protein